MFGIQVLRAPVAGNGNIGIKRLNRGHQISKLARTSMKITEITTINNKVCQRYCYRLMNKVNTTPFEGSISTAVHTMAGDVSFFDQKTSE